MTTPYSATFDLLDWNVRAASTADANDATITDPVYGALQGSLLLESSNRIKNATSVRDGLSVAALAGSSITLSPILGTYQYSTTVPDTFTLEFDIQAVGDLPDDFRDKDKRIFVGAVNSSKYTAGFLISKLGLAVASNPYADEADIVLLQGSHRFIVPDNETWKKRLDNVPVFVTIRAIVYGDDGRMEVYITDTSVAYEDDSAVYGAHEQRYAVPAMPSVLNFDQILIGLRSLSRSGEGANYQVILASLRLATGAVDSPSKPVAVLPVLDRLLVGKRHVLDGRQSFDPNGNPLTFEWNIVERPVGSTALLSGGSYAEVTIGTVIDDNQVTVRHRDQQTSVNGFRLVFIARNGVAPLRFLEVRELVLTVQLETGGLGNIKTTAEDLASAINSRNHPSYLQRVADILAAEIPSGTTGQGLLTTGSYELTGGIGSSLSKTVLAADAVGLYRLSLRVNNGSLYSDYEVTTLFAAEDQQLLDHRPNTDYVWRALSDAWSDVEGKKLAEVLWSAASQVISNELLQLWQRDYNKSIKTISRRFQRRWLSFPLRVNVPDPLQDTLVMLPGVVEYFRPLREELVYDGSARAFESLVSSAVLLDTAIPADTERGSKLIAGKQCVVVNPGGVTNTLVSKVQLETSGVLSRTVARFSTRAVNGVRVVAEGNYARYVDDPNVSGALLVEVVGQLLSLSSVVSGDLLVLDNQDGTSAVYTILTGEYVDTSGAEDVLLRNTVSVAPVAVPPTVDGTLRRWRIVGSPGYVQIHQQPYFDLGSRVNLLPSAFKFCDAVIVSMPNRVDGGDMEVRVPLLHVTASKVFPDWRAFFAELDVVNAASPVIGADENISTSWDLVARSKLVGFCRTETIPVVDELRSVPVLGSSTITSEMVENADYTIGAGQINILPTNELSLITRKGTSSVTLADGKALANREIDAVIFTEGDIGYYSVINVSLDGKRILLDRPLTFTGTFAARTPRFAATSNVPPVLWGEIGRFSNDKHIEDNFGVLVGLPRELLAAPTEDIDYLSIVKGLWVAFYKGPTVDSLRLAGNALLGLPYAEEGGIVTVIADEDTDGISKIIIKTPNQGGYSTYYYPQGYPLAINPRTGRTIKSVTLQQSREWFLTKAEQKALKEAIDDPSLPELHIRTENGRPVPRRIKDEQRLALSRAERVDDATVDEYTALVTGVEVYDYVSQPERIAALLTGASALEKHHTFVLSIPTGALSRTEYLPALQAFIQEWKPARTNVLLLGAFQLSDSIDPIESMTLNTTVLLSDTPHSLSMAGPTTTASVLGSRPYVYPEDTTLDRGWLEADAYNKYESGYAEGRVDDYSGDGSWNATRQVVDMVNQTDSDIDIFESFMWLPIHKVDTLTQFTVGERVELWDYTVPPGSILTGYGWDTDVSRGYKEGACPVILHIGSGEHPCLPFGINNPQDDHPYTYLLLGYKSTVEDINYAHETRLRAVARRSGSATWVRGATSGAVAELLEVSGGAAFEFPNYDKAIDPTDPGYQTHRFYFQLVYVFSTDKSVLYGPHVEMHAQVTQYIPIGGATISTLETELDEAQNDLQLQVHPYFPGTPADEQFVPSVSPGFFSNWSDKVPGDSIVWGWDDVGELSAVNNHSTFTSHPSVIALQNVHIGKRVRAWRELHFTHGWTSFVVPDAIVTSLDYTKPGYVRLNGYYFIDDDPTRVAVPDNTPSSFDGTIGGSWVFFRNIVDGVETAVSAVTFETGTAGAPSFRTVHGIDGFVQPSDGHIIETPIPVLDDGVYDIILRQYRPYKINAADPVSVKMTEYVVNYGYVHSTTMGLGGDDFGGGDLGV